MTFVALVHLSQYLYIHTFQVNESLSRKSTEVGEYIQLARIDGTLLKRWYLFPGYIQTEREDSLKNHASQSVMPFTTMLR